MEVLLRQKMLLIIRALYFCMEKNWSTLEKKFQVTPAQQHILFLLSSHKNELTPSELSDLGCWHASTVSRLLKPLKERGLIQVAVNKEQPRFKKVSITANGKCLLNQLADAFTDLKHLPFELGDLTEEELSDFLEYGQRILRIQKGEDFVQMLMHARIEDYDYV